jgi:hypothetical protein
VKKFGLILALAVVLPVSALVSVNTAVAQDGRLGQGDRSASCCMTPTARSWPRSTSWTPKGSPQILLEGKMVTVPTLDPDGRTTDKFSTSLTKKDMTN